MALGAACALAVRDAIRAARAGRHSEKSVTFEIEEHTITAPRVLLQSLMQFVPLAHVDILKSQLTSQI